MPLKTADAVWSGTLTEGRGQLTSPSGRVNGDYTWKSRSEDGAPGVSPEELIAAAHAGCFSMALSHILSSNGHKPEQLRTHAKVKFDKQGDGFAITGIAASCEGRVPGLDASGFQKFAEMAKVGCPVSKALASVPITLDAKLLG